MRKKFAWFFCIFMSSLVLLSCSEDNKKGEEPGDACFRHALPKSRETQSLTNRYSSACSSSMPSMTFVCRVSPGLV